MKMDDWQKNANEQLEALDTLLAKFLALRMVQVILSESDPVVLRKIAEVLGRIGDMSTIARLRPHLQHEIARTRWAMQQAVDDILVRHAG